MPNASAKSPFSRSLLLTLALCGGFAPFAIDAYLPGLPAIADEFGTDASVVQLTLTAFLISMGLAQLVIGPLSDQLGRRRLLLVGVLATAVASAVCALAPNVWVLIVARVFQGAFGAAGVVLTRAIVADLGQGVGIAKAFSMLMSVQSLAPLLAPVVGGLLIHQWGWRSVYWFLAGLGVVMFVAAFVIVQESLPPERRRPGGVGAALGDMLALLRSPEYLVAVGFYIASFMVLFTYISASSFVLQRVVGLESGQFSLAFAINSSMLLVANLVNGLIVPRVGSIRVLQWSTWLMAFAVAWLAVAVFAFGTAGWMVLLGFWLLVTSKGFMTPNVAALCVERAGARSGSGSALMGAGQFVCSAGLAPLASIGDGTTAVPMAVIMVVLTVVILTLLAGILRQSRAA